METEMFCNECGAENTRDGKFCSDCGKELSGLAQSTTTSELESVASMPETAALYEVTIGPKNTEFYLEKFRKFDSGASAASWNWPSFFVTFYWMLYRKMWGLALAYWILPAIIFFFIGLIPTESETVGGVVSLAYMAGIYLLIPIFSNSIYHRHIRSKIEKAKSSSTDLEEIKLHLARQGGTSGAALVIVIVLLIIPVIGVLAAIALPAYHDYIIRSKVSEGLAVAAEYKQVVTDYTSRTAQLPNSVSDLELPGFTPTEMVRGVALESGGKIVVTLGISPPVDGKSFSLTPQMDSVGALTWKCAPVDVEAKYLPAACRN